MSTLVGVDRSGGEHAIDLPARGYGRLRLSPDGTRIASEVTDPDTGETDVWAGRLDGAPLAQFSFDRGAEADPVWTPDGRQLIFVRQAGEGGVFMKRSDGSGPLERLLAPASDGFHVPWFVTPDGKALVYYEVSGTSTTERKRVVHRVELSGDHASQPVSLFFPVNAALSPDGRWVAHISDETGDYEVYVQPYPNPDNAKWRITSGGGRDPVWSRDGRELFYLRNTTMFAMKVTTEASFSTEPAIALFDGPYLDASGRYHDIAPDGGFLMIKPGWLSAERETPLHIVLNWHEELNRLVPTN